MHLRASVCLAVVTLVACGPSLTGRDGGADSAFQDAGPVDAGILLAARIQAAQTTAANHTLCASIVPFYWEIGDVNARLVSASQGTTFTADTEVELASASKLVFGAYVVERFKASLGQVDLRAITMRSGYTSFTSCAGTATVAQCHTSGANGTLTAANLGRFDYGGGHFQKYAVDLGLGAMRPSDLAAEFHSMLGAELNFRFMSPQLAGGMRGSAAQYALLLRKILSGGLALRDHLGENAVCTLNGPDCPTALSSPIADAWHYSYGHWVEDAPTTGDGAFSSPGAFGFYPWIDATRSFYGVISRRSLGGARSSASCGGVIRKAFVTGLAQ